MRAPRLLSDQIRQGRRERGRGLEPLGRQQGRPGTHHRPRQGGRRDRQAARRDKLTPADPRDLADVLAYALRYQGRKRVHNANEIMAEIANG
jgi:hypothetical protein